jgi:DNA-binding SARP family transcriptional activator
MMDKAGHTLHIALMGQFRLSFNESSIPSLDTASHQALFAYLVLYAGQAHTRQHLAFTFWPDSNEGQARTNLRKTLHHLRQTLPQADTYLQTDRHTVMWHSDAPYQLDVDEFIAAVSQAQQAPTISEQEHYLEKAEETYRGELLPGHYEEWILAYRETLRLQYLNCLIQHIQILEDKRSYDAAITLAQQLLQVDPLHESTYRNLMRLQALNGNRAGALRVYHTCATTLERELDVPPSTATQEAYRRLLALDDLPTIHMSGRIQLVGRSTSWEAMQTAWKQSTQERPLLTLIRGEAGIGKTRLAEELLDWSTRQGFTTLRAANHAPANNLPYGSLSAWLRTANDRNLLSGLSDKWLREISRILPELMADHPTLPSPDPITESWQRQHLFTALAHAILHQPQPILLFVDDLHWCDTDTLEWLCFFLHFDPQARFLLLGTVRSEEISNRHPLTALCHDLQREGSLVEINLDRLDAGETKTLAEQVAGKPLNDDEATHLFTETEGVPLFIVELARDGLFLPSSSPPPAVLNELEADIRLPDKVRVVIERRLANLTSTAYELAGLAAVVGRSFTFDLLASACTQQETTLIQALDELWQQRIIRDQGTFLYDFSHDKIRQVAYHSASPVKRQQWHKQIIKALETQHAAGQDVEYHQLGTHYEAVGNYHKALECYQNAAEAAQNIYAHQDVLANLERALAQTEKFNVDGVLASNLHEKRGSVLFTMSEYEEAINAWKTAVSYTNNPIDQARLLKQQGEAWNAEQNHKAGSSAYYEALNCLESMPNHHHDTLWWQAWIDIQICRSEMFYFTDQLTELAAVIEKLQPAIESYGDAKQAYPYRNTQHMLDYRQKRYELTAPDVATCRHLLALAEEARDRQQIDAARFSLGFTYLWTGFLDDAIFTLSTAGNAAAESGNLFLQNQCLAYLTLTYRRLGDVVQVKASVKQHRPLAAQCHNLFYQGILIGNEAWLSYQNGDWETAVYHGKSALATWGALPFPLKWTALWPLLAAYLAQGNLAKAADCAAQMLTPPQQILGESITAVLQQAVHAWQTGDEVTCRKQLTTALALVQADHTF